MAKVYYGDGDWTIGDYAYIRYGGVDLFCTKYEEWPARIQGREKTYPEATIQQVHDLIETIFAAESIRIK